MRAAGGPTVVQTPLLRFYVAQRGGKGNRCKSDVPVTIAA